MCCALQSLRLLYFINSRMTDSSTVVGSRIHRRNDVQEFIPLDDNDPITYNFQATHKTGHALTKKFRNEWFQHHSTYYRRITPTVDSKTVVTVRDLFDATVSGYLYHKTGHECWLDHDGIPGNKLDRYWIHKVNWNVNVTTVPVPEHLVWPDYNLCQALETADSERIGLGIYLEFARKNFYQSIYELSKHNDPPTLSVCMEDMRDHPLETAIRIRDFYAGTNMERYKNPKPNQRRLVSPAGGHATNHDPALRKKLYDLARELDCEYFGCETQMWNEEAVRCARSVYRPQHDDASSKEALCLALLVLALAFLVDDFFFRGRRSRLILILSMATKATTRREH